MALKEINAICPTCRTAFRATPSRTFLGFQKLSCPKGHRVVYPLTKGYRITYIVLLVLMVITIVGNAAQGKIAVPGILGVLVIIGLLRDWNIRKQVAGLKPAPPPRASTPPVRPA